MAAAFDAASTSSAGVSTNTVSWSHTSSGSDRAIFVGVAYQGGATTCSMTFDGSSTGVTQLWNKRDDIGIQSSVAFKLIAQGTGAKTIVITLGAAADLIVAGGVSLTGVDQTTATRTAYTNNEAGGAGTGPTVTDVDSQSGDIVLDCAITLAGTIAVGADQTSRCEDDAIGGGSSSFGISTQDATGANTVMSWTGGSFWATGSVAFFPSGGGGGGNVNLFVGKLGSPLIGKL